MTNLFLLIIQMVLQTKKAVKTMLLIYIPHCFMITHNILKLFKDYALCKLIIGCLFLRMQGYFNNTIHTGGVKMFKDNKEDIKRAAEDAKENEKENVKQEKKSEDKSGEDKTKENIQESFEQ